MKIAFIGTHGTGKTTLAHSLMSDLKKKGVDAGFISEIARSCPFPINEETTKKSQVWIILNQIIKELETEEKYDVVISDRSVLDGYCYYFKKFGRSSALENLILEHLKTYSLLIRIPINTKFLQKDSIRSTNPKFQKEIDEIFNLLTKKFKIKYMIFNGESENMDEIVKKIIKDLNKSPGLK